MTASRIKTPVDLLLLLMGLSLFACLISETRMLTYSPGFLGDCHRFIRRVISSGFIQLVACSLLFLYHMYILLAQLLRNSGKSQFRSAYSILLFGFISFVFFA